MKTLTKALQLILFYTFFIGKVYAQTYTMPVSGTQTDTVCGGTFYDSGGPVGNYSNNGNGIMILYPAVSGQYVMMQFTSIVLNDAGDRLRIFSGTDTMSVPLFNLAGPTSSAGCGTTIVSNVPGGCLTVHFKTDAVANAAGWRALLYCNPTISPMPPGTTCATPVVIPSIPFTDNQCTECMLNDYQSQSGICNTGYAGEDIVYSYAASGTETVCITLSNATANTRLAIYNGCPGSGGSCITPLPMVGNDTMQVTLPGAGTYYIIIDAASGYSCYDLSIVSCIVGIDEHQNPQDEVSIFPNPVTNELRIENAELKIKEVKIHDTLGKVILNYQLSIINYQLSVDISQLIPGIYFVEVKGTGGKILNRKFVKM